MTEETKRAEDVLDGIDEGDFRIAHKIVMDGDRFRAVYHLARKARRLEESGLEKAVEELIKHKGAAQFGTRWKSVLEALTKCQGARE